MHDGDYGEISVSLYANILHVKYFAGTGEDLKIGYIKRPRVEIEVEAKLIENLTSTSTYATTDVLS